MNNLLLHILDCFFLVFHSIFTLFNMTGWIWKKTRKIHMITIFLTAFSWFILGIWHGFGYCFCTDWHWQVREKLGNPISSYSYIHFLLREITGFNAPPAIIDKITLAVFIICVLCSILLNINDQIKKTGES